MNMHVRSIEEVRAYASKDIQSFSREDIRHDNLFIEGRVERGSILADGERATSKERCIAFCKREAGGLRDVRISGMDSDSSKMGTTTHLVFRSTAMALLQCSRLSICPKVEVLAEFRNSAETNRQTRSSQALGLLFGISTLGYTTLQTLAGRHR